MEWGTFSKAQSEQKINRLLSVVPDAIVSRTPRTFVTDSSNVTGREVVIVDVELYTYNEKGKKTVRSSFQYNNLDNRK